MTQNAGAYQEVEQIVGSQYITDKDVMKAAYSRNVDPAFPDRWADIIVRPGSPEEISGIVQIANKYMIPIVPRGGGSDLVGGAASQGGILMDLTRLNRILEINEKDFYCAVECGVTWAALVSELYKRNLTTGVLGPGSGFSATIGGGLSNSTAGFGSTKYGLVPENCLGVEVVLPNPTGDIIRTGAAANKYAAPICRYGFAPDFSGLFMGDAGTMGIKTKAFLKLYPNPPFKILRNFMLNKNKYEIVSELMYKLQSQVADGMHDLYVVPREVVQLQQGMAKNRPPEAVRIKGPVFMFILEAFDSRILDIVEEKVNQIMADDATPFDWHDIDLDEVPAKDWKFTLRFPYNYFNRYVSLLPSRISCTTCHKIPVSKVAEKEKLTSKFDFIHVKDYPPESAAVFARSLHLLPNGHCVVAGGFNAVNSDEQHESAMNMWHKKIRFQVRYGAIHYWLGESISQSIVESGVYSPEYARFFKDMKHVVDPNFILSPNKFHMHSYDDNIADHIVEDEVLGETKEGGSE
ncbi:MAG TPA: FAD-binding oxidoreductase [Candidatus Lokiarchaeia archaeon]|nr:FAD-binding oxidoreductase [Candidatus Lokiarchaeia archaeon]